MANKVTVDLGRVILNRGNYNASATYYKDNVVQYQGSAYICSPVGFNPKTNPNASIIGVAPWTSDPDTLNTGWSVFADGAKEELGRVALGSVYDVSAFHPTSGVSGGNAYASLSAALAVIPQSKRHGGMSIKYVQSSDNKYVQKRLMHPLDNASTAAVDFMNEANWQGADSNLIAGSQNLAESGASLAKIRDIAIINTDASSLIGSWVVDGTAITFSGSGMNGTFTSHTAPSKPTNTRPYFRFQGFEAGKKYRLRFKATIDSSNIIAIGLFYAAGQTVSWSSAKLIDVDGNEAVCYGGSYLDCIFEAVNEKTYLGFSINSLGIDETVTITDFSISALDDINDVDAEVKRLSNQYLNKISFVGAGDSYVGTRYYNVLIPNHTYKVSLLNTNWSLPSGLASNKYIFNISSYIGTTQTVYKQVRADGTVLSEYTFKVGANTPDYLLIAGRATVGTEVFATIDDITESVSSINDFTKTIWPKHFTKNDYDFRGRLLDGVENANGTNYVYVFRISDYIFLEAAGLPSGFKMQASIYEDFENAKKHNSVGVHAFANGISPATFNVLQMSCWGTSDYNHGFLSVLIQKTNSSAITDADITQIESTLVINFYPTTCQGQIDEIEDEIKELHGLSYNEDDFVPWISDSSGLIQQTEPTRVKFLKENYVGGKKISVDITDCLTAVPLLVYAVGVFNSLIGAQKNQSGTNIESIQGSWTTENIQNVLSNASGVLSVYFKKIDSSAFTSAEYIAIRNNIKITVKSASETSVDKNFDNLPIGELTNSTDKIVTSSYVACVPYIGVKYYFQLPSGVKARVASGNNQASFTTVSDWVENGGSVQLPSGASNIVQRIDFCLANGNDLSAATIGNYIQSGDIIISYNRIDAVVSQRNYENEKYIKAAIYRLVYQNAAEIMTNSGVPSLPTLVHVSDLHGDMKRFENAIQYANELGAHAVVASGDNVMYYSSNGTGFMKDVITKYPSIPFLNCIGNHEASPANTYNNTYLFSNHISPYVEQGGYEASDGVSATMPYYYKDLDAEKLRVITLNQYDNACYASSGKGGRLGQTQITWFCNTLLSTPAGYGVIIMMHSPEDKVDTPDELNSWNQTVNWDGSDEDEYGYAANGLYVNAIRPIKTIVDAFIGKTAISTSYDENTLNGNNGETVTISADFSNCADGVEFICYLTGHRHKDNIGYVHTATNRQLMLNICCSNGHYPKSGGLSFAEGTDLPRGDRGVTQDAFNIYGIDRQNGRVKIARVGSNVNFEGIDRKFIMAMYKYKRYSISKTLTDCSLATNDYYIFSTTENAACSYANTLVVGSGYNLPTTITVQMGSTTLIAETDYTYDSTTGVIEIASVTDDLSITASGVSE